VSVRKRFALPRSGVQMEGVKSISKQWHALLVARARRCAMLFRLRSMSLNRKSLQSLDTSSMSRSRSGTGAIALDFWTIDRCVDLQGSAQNLCRETGLDARLHAHRPLDTVASFPTVGVDLGDSSAHLIWRLPEAVQPSPRSLRVSTAGTYASNDDWVRVTVAARRAVRIVDVLRETPGCWIRTTRA